MSRADYLAKRDFTKTAEPRGSEPQDRGQKGWLYIIQKHAARQLHYDLRLEHNGALLSWAVPKGPSLDPKQKRLAVKVEDHPLEYGDFEGVIPQGEYGGGTVMLWDRGHWSDDSQGGVEGGLRKGHLRFELHGEKLRGTWNLVRSKGRDNNEWLLIKRDDEHARPESEFDVKEQLNLSVKTGRTMDQIASERDAVWSGTEGLKEPSPLPDPAEVEGAKKAKFPEKIAPMLASPRTEPPTGEGWVHEVKFDGYRMLCAINNGDVSLLTRRGHDWTHRFPLIAGAASRLGLSSAILDGEVVVLDETGLSDFQALQNVMKDRARGEPVFLIFDLIHLQGYDLTSAPLLERKRLLRAVLSRTGDLTTGPLRFCEHLTAPGQTMWDNACKLGAEGIVSKRAAARYRMGDRSKDWLKVRCLTIKDLPIVGFTDPARSRVGIGALIVAERQEQGGNLVCRGKVGTGFDEATLHDLRNRLGQIERKAKPQGLTDVPRDIAKSAHWVEPKLTAEIAFAQITDDGRLRHPTYRGLVEDREADRTTPDPPPPEETMPPRKETSNKKSNRAAVYDRGASEARSPASATPPKKTPGLKLLNVAISNPDKILYPNDNLTKRHLVEYWAAVADFAMPEIQGRPLSLVRCPSGIGSGKNRKPCFFQKDHPNELGQGLTRVEIIHDEGPKNYAVVTAPAGLVELAQLGALEFHPWGAKSDRPERPDRIIIDLDPGPDVPWSRIVETARGAKQLFDALGLVSFLRTTGGKGLHIVVPIERRHDWDEVKAFSHDVVRLMERTAPNLYTTNVSKAQRKGKIYLDYLRNSRGATAIATLSPRAREGAPVAFPLAWHDLTENLSPQSFNLTTVPNLLKKTPWPWPNINTTKQRLTNDIKQRIKD